MIYINCYCFVRNDNMGMKPVFSHQGRIYSVFINQRVFFSEPVPWKIRLTDVLHHMLAPEAVGRLKIKGPEIDGIISN